MSMEDDLLQLTLQIRNRKEVDKRYAGFRGDKLIGVPLVVRFSESTLIQSQDQNVKKVGLVEDLRVVFASKNWTALGRLVNGFISGKGLDVGNPNKPASTVLTKVGSECGSDCRRPV